MNIESQSPHPNAYAALLAMYGDRLEPKETPALSLLKSYRTPGHSLGLVLKSELATHPEWDEHKHPRNPDGTFSHAAFQPDQKGSGDFKAAIARWFGMPTSVRNSGQPLVIGDPPAVLRMLGAGPEPLQIDRGTLIKVSRPHGNNPKGHNITKDQLSQLPARLADPIAVYSVKGATGLEVLTQLIDSRGERVMVAVQIGKQVGKGKVVNDVASIYGRPDKDYIRWLESGTMLYCDSEKENPACQSGLLPYLRRRVPVRRGEQTIATPNDVVKYYRQQKNGDVAAKSASVDKFDLLKAEIDAYVSKSDVAAHTRTLPNGQVVQIRGFSNSRGRDAHTPDLFRQHLAAPKMKFTPEQARNPELFTPDLFSGETKASRPKRFQVRDSAGKVIKVFTGENAERDAKLHILENSSKRLNLKNVTFDD